MEIRTKAYGTVDIDENNIITFENGLIGFEETRKYVVLGNSDETDILLWLQSVEEENLAFVVIQPRFFKPDYKPEIHISDLADLDVKKQEDLLIYSIVVVPDDFKKMTANLRAPVVINVKNNKAKQLLLNDDAYNIREFIFAQS